MKENLFKSTFNKTDHRNIIIISIVVIALIAITGVFAASKLSAVDKTLEDDKTVEVETTPVVTITAIPTDESEVTATPSVTPIEVASGTPTPSVTEKELDLSEFDIQVQNGSGLPGVAAKLQTLLKTDGFNVANVGNADNFAYTKTVLKLKEDVDTEFASELKMTLTSSGYEVESGTELDASSRYDAIIIIGKE